MAKFTLGQRVFTKSGEPATVVIVAEVLCRPQWYGLVHNHPEGKYFEADEEDLTAEKKS